LKDLHCAAPLLRKRLDLNLNEAMLSDEEWEPFETYLTMRGVRDFSRPDCPSYKVPQTRYYRQWVQYALCIAKVLGAEFVEDETKMRLQVLQFFRNMIGMDGGIARVDEGDGGGQDESMMLDFASVEQVSAKCRVAKGPRPFSAFVVTARNGQKFWVWASVNREAQTLGSKEQVRKWFDGKGGCRFEHVKVPPESTAMQKLVEAKALVKMGGKGAVLVSVKDLDVEKFLWCE
jgi:hypothetical protein